MFRNRKIKKIFATFFGGVYLFVALFSQNFHQHGSAEVFKDFHFKKSEKTFSKSTIAETFTDCLSCHILHDGNSVVPQDFHFQFTKADHLLEKIFTYEQGFANCEQRFIHLRGPPHNFI